MRHADNKGRRAWEIVLAAGLAAAALAAARRRSAQISANEGPDRHHRPTRWTCAIRSTW